MQEQLESRLKELRDEYTTGQKVMAELQNKQAELHQTLLRISGAIQVLEELSQGDSQPLVDSSGARPSAN
jgi:prefoldin subunit 5